MAREKKLHEILAVEQQLKGQAHKTRTELQHTFANKRHLFEEKLVTFQPSAEGAAQKTEAQSFIQTSVGGELAWLAGIWAPAIDTALQVQVGNTVAKADVFLENGVKLLADVPAAALLEMEKRCAEVQELVKTIPTLDPAKGFRPDENRQNGIYVAREIEKSRTAKVQEPLQLAPATDKHPAQVQLITKDVVTGTIKELEWSALLTPAQKGDIIARAEEISRAVKQARMRANDVVIPPVQPAGKSILEYVFGVKAEVKE
jgi:hypothetical protein